MDKLLKILKDNVKFYSLLCVVILIGSIGVTFSLAISSFRNIGINTTIMNIDANISYDTNSNGAEIVSNGKMLPISDSLVTGVDVTDSRIVKAKFYVKGVDDNPSNTIYDVALYDINMDCDLKTEYLKWRLYKNGSKLYEGTFSPAFDTLSGNRLVLTDTQQDLTSEEDEYVFLMWISDTCNGDINTCSYYMDQSMYLNKVFKASIKIELSAKDKKALERVTASFNSCNYVAVDIPSCNDVIYNGSAQTIINEESYYTIENNTGTNSGTYATILKLNDGYKWSNGSTDDKIVKCLISKRDVIITTLDQNITSLGNISSTLDNVSVSGLASGDRIEIIILNVNNYESGVISVNNVKIVNADGKDVTENYNIIKNNKGILNVTSD